MKFVSASAAFRLLGLSMAASSLWTPSFMVNAATMHPLDSLTSAEYEAVVNILNTDGKLTETSRFPQISLLPPDKALVKAWTMGDEDFPRMAVAYIKDGAMNYKAEIDLKAETVTMYEPAGGEGMVLLEEIFGATDLALSSTEMVEGLAQRGLTPEDVYCLPLTAGSYGDPMEKGKRLMKVPCYKLPSGSNWYSQPVEGLFAFVDLNELTVLEVVDQGVLPLPEKDWGFGIEEIEENYGSFRGVTGAEAPNVQISKEALPSQDMAFTIDGSMVVWDIWRFQFRVDKRPGMILSSIDVLDEDTYRSVLYEAHLSEVFVPYMDPDAAWYWRTYMDSGEYGFGIFMSPLTRGVDCPADAAYLPVTLHDDLGMPFDIPDSVCIFERLTGDPSWRHFEIFEPDKPAEGRPAKELVFRYASEVGNYDYLVDYIFMEDGTIRVAVGSTGLDAVKGVASTSMNDAGAADETKFGTLIAPNIVAVYHSHFFNFRLDFDIDGLDNEFTKAKLAPIDTSSFDIPRTSMWGVEYETIATEIDARTRINPISPSNWYFGNPNTESALGHHPAYELIPSGSYVYSLLSLDDMPVARNAYIENHLYVTPYDPTQIYAGGEYSVQSTGNETLHTWTDMDRSIENTDLVAWYTVGFHHVPRMEDWPVMPTHWAVFKIRPFNFFDHNPAITVAPPGMDVTSKPGVTAEDDEPEVVDGSGSLSLFMAIVSSLLVLCVM